ncbi:hypothetical protein CFOL_v3_17670, partial [Cephalotus follicularis]
KLLLTHLISFFLSFCLLNLTIASPLKSHPFDFLSPKPITTSQFQSQISFPTQNHNHLQISPLKTKELFLFIFDDLRLTNLLSRIPTVQLGIVLKIGLSSSSFLYKKNHRGCNSQKCHSLCSLNSPRICSLRYSRVLTN